MVSKKKKKKVFTKIERDFSAEIGNSNVFFAQIQVVSKNKKKKKVFTKIETDFSPDSLRLGRWGGMLPEREPNYSKQRLIFWPKSLLLGWWGGDASPPSPPLNPPLSSSRGLDIFNDLWASRSRTWKCVLEATGELKDSISDYYHSMSLLLQLAEF